MAIDTPGRWARYSLWPDDVGSSPPWPTFGWDHGERRLDPVGEAGDG